MSKFYLTQLGDRVGIEKCYWDVYGDQHKTSDETLRMFLSAMGYRADDEESAKNSLRGIDERPWKRLLEPVTILRTVVEDSYRISEPKVLVVLPEKDADQNLNWSIVLEGGQTLRGNIPTRDLAVIDRRDVDGEPCKRVALYLPDDMPLGYHRVHIQYNRVVGEGALIVAPHSAYQPAWLGQNDRRVWGVACQLYSLRTPTNWGIGDFSDLMNLCLKTAGNGGDAVGLPPLHTLFHTCPERVSPYSPSSRLFLNPIYIDVMAVLEYATCAEAQAIVQSPEFTARLDAARTTDAVNFLEVADLKQNILNVLFKHFELKYPVQSQDERRKSFDNYVAKGGERLHNFALFEALLEHFSPQLSDQWPRPYLDPVSEETQKFARDHPSRVQFYIYQQWLADEQLAAAAKCGEDNMFVGLYRDLAVGVAPGGADAWIDPDAFVEGVRFGAPPDALGPMGQDWGMPPFNPDRLYEKAYGPYIEMLRSNMRYAGALRIDHVMWLQRMFWIPPGGDGRSGAYVRYPLDDLLAILALESWRSKCLVIGEALGTVTEGFRERLASEGILSYCLLQFERHENGFYVRPDAYPHLALATPASHDLPTLAGFWREIDIQVQQEIGLILSNEVADERRMQRARERDLLISALVDQKLINADFPNAPDISDSDLMVLVTAVHKFLACSPSALMMVNLEDILVSTTQINVPGTVDEYPNWRLKLPVDLDQVCGEGGMADVASHLCKERTANHR